MGVCLGIGNGRSIVICGLLTGAVCISESTHAQGWKLATNLTVKAAVTASETYDDNVYILNSRPNPDVNPPSGFTISEPNKESFVTTVTPSLALDYRPSTAFTAILSYAPEIATYHCAHSEDHVTHRGVYNFSGRIQELTYESLNSVTWIDGSDSSYITIRPGDCRCIGGIPLRDRREALIFKDGLTLTIPAQKWFFRPVARIYFHDFQTAQYANLAVNRTSYIYDNFIDRWDVNGGLDIGYKALRNTKLVVGYRYGHQHQGTVPTEVPSGSGNVVIRSSPYDNDYQRILFGIEGTPFSWLKLAVLAGPDFRNWNESTPAGFNRGEVLWYIDGTATLTPTTNDTFTVRITRYEQPAFTSQSVYQDVKYDVVWRHKITSHFTAGAGFTAYLGDWQAPVHRTDWIYTPSVMASYAFSPHFSAEASWSYDNAKSRVPTGPNAPYSKGREFTRNLVSLAVNYSF